MAASSGDKFTRTANGGIPTATTVTAPRVAAATSLTVGTTSQWPTASKVHFATYQINTSGAKVAGTQIDWSGIVTSGTAIGSLTRTGGATDAGNSVGDVVVMMPTAGWGEDLAEGLEVEHNRNGTHAAITATSIVSTGAITGTTLTGTSLVNTGDSQLRGTSLETIQSEGSFDFVATGGVWSGDSYGSTLAASMTAVTCYINGRRGTIGAVTSRSFTASKDTYVDILNNSGTFSLVYTEVANNAASPALAANSIRLAIVVTGAGNIASAGSINQGQIDKVLPIASSTPYTTTDSLGNLVAPRDPFRRVLGARQVTADKTGTSITAASGLSVPVIVPTGRRIRVSLTARAAAESDSSTISSLTIWDGTVGSGTQVAQGIFSTAAVNQAGGAVCAALLSPSSSSKTYNVGVEGIGGGTATLQAGSTYPATLLVELV